MPRTEAAPPPLAPARNPWVVLLWTSLAVFAVFLDTTILFVAFSSIRADFVSVSPSSLSWVLNAYTIIFAALLIPAGRLADRVGRRRMFLAGVILFTVASMLCGVAPTVPLLVMARVAQAVGAAALVPSSLALVLQTFPREKIPVAVAIWGAVGAAAGAAGPTLGAFVVENLSWRWAFFVNLPVGVFSLVLGRRVLPERREVNPVRLPEPLGVALLAIGIALAAYGIVQAEEWGWGSARFIAAILGAGALITLFIGRCRRVSNPLLDLSLFRSRNFRWANAATLVYSVGFNAMFLGNVLFLPQVWGYSVLRAGLAISVGPAIVACTAPFFGKLAGRIGQRALLIPGGLIWAAGGIYLFSRASLTPDYLGVYLPTVCLTGLGVALTLPQMSSAAVQGLPVDSYGAGSAVNRIGDAAHPPLDGHSGAACTDRDSCGDALIHGWRRADPGTPGAVTHAASVGDADTSSEKHPLRATWPIHKRQALQLLVSYLVMTAAFAGIGFLITGPLDGSSLVHTDERVAASLADGRTSSWNDASYIGSTLAETWVKVLVTALIAIALLVRLRRWREPLVICVALVLEAAAFISITYIVGRNRPDVPRLDTSPVGSSFPSGHVAAAVAYSAIAVVVFWLTRNIVARMLTTVLCAVIPVIVGISRMYRGMHYLSDVVFGALLGVCAVVVAVLILRPPSTQPETHHAEQH